VNSDRGSTIGDGCEINLDFILALDAEIIRLRCARNSLLNVARIPPEILRYVFCFSVVPEVVGGRLAGMRECAHYFLFVCRNWFQVVRRTVMFLG